MPISLPPAIDAFFASETDIDRIGEAFAPDAVVGDENETHQGLAAIRKWREDTTARYGQTSVPETITEADGKTLVTAQVTGEFPGSPITLTYTFGLVEGRIARLVIG